MIQRLSVFLLIRQTPFMLLAFQSDIIVLLFYHGQSTAKISNLAINVDYMNSD
jgi:hypothetical protein